MSEWVYHVTYFRNMESISENGLNPDAATGISTPGYMGHSKGKTFFTDFEDVDYWYNEAENGAEAQSDNIYDDGYVPVVLAFLRPEIYSIDEAMKNSIHTAFYTKESIIPDDLMIWTGQEWIDVSDYEEVGINIALNAEYDEDSGETLYYFKRSDENPLVNIVDVDGDEDD